MRKSNKPIIYFICDRTACCPCNPDCKYTSNIAHAKNFRAESNNKTAKEQNAFGFFENENEYPIARLFVELSADIPDKDGGR